jgi:hypothetical protein
MEHLAQLCVALKSPMEPTTGLALCHQIGLGTH